MVNEKLNRTFILRTAILSDLCHDCDSTDRSILLQAAISHSLCDVQELEEEGRKDKGKPAWNPIVKFDRAEFPAPNIYSQS